MLISKNLFESKSLVLPQCSGNLLERFEESREIVGKAVIDTQPYAVCLMLSGGDDSVTALTVALLMGVKVDFIIHGNTGTGLPEVQPFVFSIAEKYNIPIIIADAGTAYEDYVMRKGFFGRGKDAHKYSYHILKVNPFDTAISKYIRHGVPGRKLLLLNGVRVEESENRADNFGDDPYRWQKNNYWVNIIHWWTKKECLQLLEDEGVQRSPVAIALGRSGECNCGTMQSEADRIAASEFNPTWGGWMMDLRKRATAKFGWDIGQNPSKAALQELKNKAAELNDFMPMCVGCKARNKQPELFNSGAKLNGANATGAE